MKILLAKNNYINKKRCLSEGAAAPSNRIIQEVDSLGNLLTAEQSNFFKNSKVRDGSGNLLVCYHGTPSPGFTEFNPQQSKSQFGKYKFNSHNVNYFTSDLETAQGYTELGIGDTGEKYNNIYACYINITNPYVVDNSTEAEIKSFMNIKDNNIRDKQIKTFERIFNKWKRRYPDEDDVDSINRDMHLLNYEFRLSDDVSEDDHLYGKLFNLHTLGSNTAYGRDDAVMHWYTLEEYFSEDCYEEMRDAIVGNYEEDYDDYFFTMDNLVKMVLLMNEEEGTNYDGIIIEDILDVGPRGSALTTMPGTDIVTLQSGNQIKSIKNGHPTNSNNINERIEHIVTDEESSDYDELFVVGSVNELKELMNKTHWNEYRVVDSSRYDGKYYVGYSMNHIHSQILRVAANNGWFPNENGSTIQMKFSDTDLVIIIPGEDNDNGVFGTDGYSVKYVFDNYTILARDYIDDTELIQKFGKLLYTDEIELYEQHNINEDMESNDFLTTVWDIEDKFLSLTESDILKLLNPTLRTTVDPESPMYILPNGKILSVCELFSRPDLRDRFGETHYDLTEAILYVLMMSEGLSDEMRFKINDYHNGEFISRWCNDMFTELTYGFGWARANCGRTWDENRFYCVLPNSMTTAQYRTLEEWMEWGYSEKEKTVLVFVGDEEANHTYSFSDYFPEDIIKKIKRYYSSGTLYESANGISLYRGVGYNNKSSQDTDSYGGQFFADSVIDASNFGEKIEVYELSPGAELFRHRSSYDYVQENNLMDIENNVLYQLSGYHTLSEAEETLLMGGEDPNLYYAMMQYIVRLDLEPQGYDGVEWEYEDDLISHQYQIWNYEVLKHIKDVDENGNELKENMKHNDMSVNEEFVSDLVPGELYHFIHNNKILYGTFKGKTKSWLYFDVEGNEVLAKPWTNVATTTEELEEIIGVVNKMEKDTKVPSQVPNIFTRVPNQHGMPMGESNELEQRAKKHKKKSKGMGWHMAVNGGDVEKGIEVFNNATSAPCANGDCGAGMGESLSEGTTTGTYCYDGPVYYRGHKISEKSNHCTTAPSMSVAARNIWYQVSKDAPDPHNYDIVDRLIRFVPDSEKSYNLSPNRAKCHLCGYDINDNGDCPVCDYGEIDLLESLSDLEAMWKLNSMDLD